MKEFKGTKGEWTMRPDFREPKIINEFGKVIFIHNQDCFDIDDENHVYYSHNKMMCNAKLIAAAPELLEACIEFVRKCECGEARSKHSYKQMKEAIEKAL